MLPTSLGTWAKGDGLATEVARENQHALDGAAAGPRLRGIPTTN